MPNQFQLNLQPVSKIEESPNMFGNFTEFFLGSVEYIISNDDYITLKSCVQSPEFSKLLNYACQSGIQYINGEFKGVFETKDNIITALQDNKEAHNYTQHELNGTFYLYDNEKFQLVTRNLFTPLHIFQQRLFNEVKNYSKEDIWNFIHNKKDPQELVYPDNDEKFIQHFFQLRDCGVFKILNNITQTTHSTVSEIVNITLTTLLNLTTEQQENQESNNESYLPNVYITAGLVLGAISAISYAGYKWYKNCTASSNYSSIKNTQDDMVVSFIGAEKSIDEEY